MKKRILFVDDEPNMLEGLQRMLRGTREEWNRQFAAGGPEALALMDQGPFDMEYLAKLNFIDRASVWHGKCQQILWKGENDAGQNPFCG